MSNSKTKLRQLATTYIGCEYDNYTNTWKAINNYSIDLLQFDLYQCVMDAIYEIIITEYYYGFNSRTTRPYIGALSKPITSGLVVSLRKLIKEENGDKDKLGARTGGDFLRDLRKITSSFDTNEKNKFNNLVFALDKFNGGNYITKLPELESQFLHKDRTPQKREFKSQQWYIYNGIPTFIKNYSQKGINHKDVFGILESFSSIMIEYLNSIGIRFDVFMYEGTVEAVVDNALDVFNIKDCKMKQKIVDYLTKNLDKTLKLINWTNDK